MQRSSGEALWRHEGPYARGELFAANGSEMGATSAAKASRNRARARAFYRGLRCAAGAPGLASPTTTRASQAEPEEIRAPSGSSSSSTSSSKEKLEPDQHESRLKNDFSQRGASSDGASHLDVKDEVEEAKVDAPSVSPPHCPAEHVLTDRMAEGEYECDLCGEDVIEGERFYDCRACDFSACYKFCKDADDAAKAKG